MNIQKSFVGLCLGIAFISSNATFAASKKLQLSDLKLDYQFVYAARSISSVNKKIAIGSPPPQQQQEFFFPAEIVLNAGAGYFINQQKYPDQYDKKLHSYVGSAISLSTSTLSYALLKDSTLPIATRETIVRYSGPAMSLIVGILKEATYDRLNPDQHTADSQDALATGIGGGILPLYFSVTF